MNAKLVVLTDSKTSNKIAINPYYITSIERGSNKDTYVRVRDDFNYYVKESVMHIVDLINN